jgi:hypothetical protein
VFRAEAATGSEQRFATAVKRGLCREDNFAFRRTNTTEIICGAAADAKASYCEAGSTQGGRMANPRFVRRSRRRRTGCAVTTARDRGSSERALSLLITDHGAEWRDLQQRRSRVLAYRLICPVAFFKFLDRLPDSSDKVQVILAKPIVVGKENGKTIKRQGVDGVVREILSVETLGASCSIQNGNAFANRRAL